MKRKLSQRLLSCMLMLPMLAAAWAQGPVTGEVTDQQGEPLAGATVMAAGQKSGVATDIDGLFSLKIDKATTLTVSYIGYNTRKVDVKPGEKDVKIVLEEASALLDEVVVVGFGTQKKINLTGAVGQASAKDLEGRPVQNAAAALQGVVPGLNISNSTSGGELNASKQVNVRGMATIGEGSSGSPLILIDGMEGDLNSINPQDIESISVLKDAAASSIYGSRAPFGVILVTTKKGSQGRTQVRYNNSFRWNKPLTPMHLMDSWEYINYVNDVTGYTSPGSVYYPEDYVEQAWLYYTGQSDNFIYENIWATHSDDDPSGTGSYRKWGSGGDPSKGTFANVDWINELYKQTAFAQEHNLTLTGGNDKVTYYVSGNYLDQSGFMRYGNDTYDRFSLMGKINAQMYKWLSIQYTGRWMRVDYSRPTWLDSGFYEKVLRRLPPINPKYDPNGYIAGDYNYILHLQDGGRRNEQNDMMTNQFQVIINPLANWNIIGEMNIRTNHDWTHQTYFPVYTHDADDEVALAKGYTSETMHLAFDSGAHSSVYEYSYRSTYLNYNIYSDYSWKMLNQLNSKAMLGFQAEDFKYRNLSASRRDLQVEDIDVLSMTTSTETYSMYGEYQKWRTAGFFGRLNFDWDSKYLLEANLRYDGTSRFRRGTRWVWSPSVSLGWNIDRENFWENLRQWVPSLKPRFSYGQLANQNTNSWYPTYRTMSLTTLGSSWLVDGTKSNTASFPSLIASNLTWEKVRTVNIGLDFAALRYRLIGSFDYFWRTNKDMVGPAVTYPATLGTSVPSENSLSLRTYGWELSLEWRDAVGDFNYSAKLSLSDDQTRILEYPNDERYISKYIAGELTGQIYGLTTIGVARDAETMAAHLATVDQSAIGSDWQAGDIMYADLNGDGKITKGTTLDDLGDLTVIGNSTPRYRFGLNLFAQWKGFDVTVFFQGVLKRDYYFNPNTGTQTTGKSAVFWGATSGGINESIFLKEHLDYWRDSSSLLGENLDSYYARPLYYTNKNREIQTRYLQNAAYMRLKNLQVGYTVPRHLTRRFYVDNLRVYFSAENLCTWTGMSHVIDPESLEVSTMKSGASYPLAQTYSFGIQLDF